jgi:elongator complex protein 6
MSIQKSFTFRDVAFYKDGSIFAPASTSNGKEISNTSNDDAAVAAITVVTSNLHTSYAWLVQAVLGLALSSSSNNKNKNNSTRTPVNANTPETVVLVTTTMASPEIYRRGLLKMGIDLSTAPNFRVIDLASLLFGVGTETASAGITSEQIKTEIDQGISTLPMHNKTRTLILLESPDLLVPLGLSPRAVSDVVAHLAFQSSNLFVFCNADAELLGPPAMGSETSDQLAFLTDLVYQATVAVSLRPLPTGRANDVTGTMTVSTGPANICDNVKEDSYQYQTANESVKLFYKW